jgi:hypothetical protein
MFKVLEIVWFSWIRNMVFQYSCTLYFSLEEKKRIERVLQVFFVCVCVLDLRHREPVDAASQTSLMHAACCMRREGVRCSGPRLDM